MTPCTYKNRRYIGERESNKLTTHPLTRNRTRVLPPLSKLDPLHSKAQGTLPSFWEDISTLPLTLASTPGRLQSHSFTRKTR